MLDPIVNFFVRVFQWIGRGIGLLIGLLLWPFMWAGRWYVQRGWILKAVVGAALVGIVVLYGLFLWNTQSWANFNAKYAETYTFAPPSDGEQISDEGAEGEVRTCTTSAITQVTADLIDFNVNQNAWVSSTIAYKLGLFGLDWDHTPWMDNKAAFQRGIHQAVRRTAVELVDTIGRVRGTSQIDQNLQDARGAVEFDEETWYFGLRPFGPKTPTPSFYRTAITSLRAYNDRLLKCEVVFNARADNLAKFVDRVASDLGSTAEILGRQAQAGGGWFDTRADDRYWFAYGQLYGYYGIMKAARHDFDAVIKSRGLGPLWDQTEAQFNTVLGLQPWIIANGREDGWLMPSHLTTMGFYVLRVRTNLVETRGVLDR